MDDVRNFYTEEAQYEQTILEIKQLIEIILSIDVSKLENKINSIDEKDDFVDFINMFLAVVGRKTNKYYYCLSEDDARYSNLTIGKVYKMSMVSPDIQSRNKIEKVLDLTARSILGVDLVEMTKKLKELFLLNLEQLDENSAVIDSNMILNSDIDFFDTLLKYLNIITDKAGRVRVFAAEQDVFAMEEAKEEYEKKSSVEKWFFRMFNKEKSVIEKMAKAKK